MFSTGNHPVEALLPMLHLKNAGFDFEIVTPNGQPVVFEMWAMPRKDIHVMNLYEAPSPNLKQFRLTGCVQMRLPGAQRVRCSIYTRRPRSDARYPR